MHCVAETHGASLLLLHLAQTSEASLCCTSRLTFAPKVVPLLTCRQAYFVTPDDPCWTFPCMHMSWSAANQSLIARGQLGQLATVSIICIQYILRSTINGNRWMNREVPILKGKNPYPNPAQIAAHPFSPFSRLLSVVAVSFRGPSQVWFNLKPIAERETGEGTGSGGEVAIHRDLCPLEPSVAARGRCRASRDALPGCRAPGQQRGRGNPRTRRPAPPPGHLREARAGAKRS